MMLLKLAWRNIWRNKRRTLITMASIFFAVLLAIVMKSIKEGTYISMIDNVAGIYSGYAQVHKAGYWDDQTLENSMIYSDSLQTAILENKNITGAIPRLETFTLSSSHTLTKGAMIVGTQPEAEDKVTHISSRIIEGEYFHKDDKAVLLGAGLASYLKLGVGDTIVLLGQGYQGMSATAKYPIKGIIKLGSPELNKTLIYLPLKEAMWLYNMENRITSIVLMMDNTNHSRSIASKLQSSLGNQYEAMSWQEMMPDIEQMIQGDRAEGVILMSILYLIISFGIFGTVLMMLAERQHEFGILISVGMQKIKLAFTVFIEVIMISVGGAISGIIAGLPIVYWFYFNPINFSDSEDMAKIYEEYGFEPILRASTDFNIFLTQALIVTIFASIIALYPFKKILRTDPIQAMRS